jgi:tetratricopeptide (TPR) repeat protein
MSNPIDVHQFLSLTTPALKCGDAQGLARVLEAHWKPHDICSLLQHPDVNVRRVAAVTLGLVGDRTVMGCLTLALRDADDQVNHMAEHALWSIWFRSGNAQASQTFREGVSLLAAESYEAAIRSFEQTITIDPLFAEAANQCAIAHFFLYQWAQSLECSRRTISMIPTHFGAIAGLGHCYTQLGDLRRAQACYQRALNINPRMPAIARMLERLKSRPSPANDHTGIFVVPAV